MVVIQHMVAWANGVCFVFASGFTFGLTRLLTIAALHAIHHLTKQQEIRHSSVPKLLSVLRNQAPMALVGRNDLL
jgi:hypothetical protein